ncbi:MAG: hypothetical protein ACD_15C00170G0002 [uncultured bacterium]|nr:MAG: hypothetical protein ACD_15C00170G0002 [uncultured bacterium]
MKKKEEKMSHEINKGMKGIMKGMGTVFALALIMWVGYALMFSKETSEVEIIHRRINMLNVGGDVTPKEDIESGYVVVEELRSVDFINLRRYLLKRQNKTGELVLSSALTTHKLALGQIVHMRNVRVSQDLTQNLILNIIVP